MSKFPLELISPLGDSIFLATQLSSGFVFPLIVLIILLGFLLVILSLKIRKKNFQLNVLEKTDAELKKQSVWQDKRTKELQNEYELKLQLYEGLSHQILSQAALVSGPIDNLLFNEEIHVPKVIKTHLDQAKDSGETLFKLLNQLSDLIEFNKGEHQLKLKSVGLCHFMSRLYSAFESQGMSREIEMKFACNLSEQLNLVIDPVRLETIVNALMMHILYCTPNNGSIKFRVIGYEEGTLQYRIKISIFYTNSANMLGFAQKPHGTDFGLGLILAQNFAEIIGADIKETTIEDINEVSFQFHAGTTTEPSDEGQVQKNRALPENESNYNPEARILVVEDYVQMRKYIKRLLQSKYKVYEARNGHEAIKVLETRQIDLVMSDLMMPGMTGIELLTAMKEHPVWKNLAFIMLTARDDKTSKLDALDLGLEDYVTKPFQSQELLARVRNSLRKNEISPAEPVEPLVDVTSHKDELTAKITQTIELNLHDVNFSVDSLVDEIGQSKRSLYRKIKEETGFTPANYIKELRLTKSKVLLKAQKYGTIAEVSQAVGYNSARVFSDHYFERFGKRPSEYL